MPNSTGSKQEQQLSRRRRLTASTYLMLKRSKRYLPPVLRGILGLVLILLGMLGFLPVLGFWMIPLGLALLATDLPPLGRWIRRQLFKRRRDQLQTHQGNSSDLAD